MAIRVGKGGVSPQPAKGPTGPSSPKSADPPPAPAKDGIATPKTDAPEDAVRAKVDGLLGNAAPFEPGDVKLPPGTSSVQVLAGASPVGWANSSKRGGGVEANVKMLNGADWSRDVVGLFLRGSFWTSPGVHMTDMTSKELNKLVGAAAPTLAESAREGAAIAKGQPVGKYGVVSDLTEAIAHKGRAPSTWRLAKKLNPRNWGHLMEAYSRMPSDQQEKFAFAFGNPNLSKDERILDGREKLAAITLQNGIKARAKDQTAATTALGDALGKAAKFPGMPEPFAKMIDFYAKVLGTLPKEFAEGLVNAKNPTSLTHKLMEEMGDADAETALRFTRHLQEVAKAEVPERRSMPEIGDHPKRDLE